MTVTSVYDLKDGKDFVVSKYIRDHVEQLNL